MQAWRLSPTTLPLPPACACLLLFWALMTSRRTAHRPLCYRYSPLVAAYLLQRPPTLLYRSPPPEGYVLLVTTADSLARISSAGIAATTTISAYLSLYPAAYRPSEQLPPALRYHLAWRMTVQYCSKPWIPTALDCGVHRTYTCLYPSALTDVLAPLPVAVLLHGPSDLRALSLYVCPPPPLC